MSVHIAELCLSIAELPAIIVNRTAIRVGPWSRSLLAATVLQIARGLFTVDLRAISNKRVLHNNPTSSLTKLSTILLQIGYYFPQTLYSEYYVEE